MFEWIHVVAVLGFAAAGLMILLWKGAASRAMASELDNHSIAEKLNVIEAELARERKARERQARELGEYRKRAEKAKRRESKQAPQPMGTASRIQDLEEARAQANRERDRARSESERLATEMSQLRTGVEADRRRRERDAAAEEEAKAETVPSEASIASQLAEAHEKIEKLQNERLIARQTEARMRKRMSNQEQLYASVRSELEVKKDRLRTQEEQLQRLQALKVAVLD